MSEAGRKRLEVIQELPRDIPGVTRMRGRHLVLGREIEVRFSEAPGQDGPAAPFLREMAELSFLDHPCFPPILDRGVARGRLFYVIPARSHKPLSFLVGEKDFPLRDRVRVCWFLASSLAAMHRKGLVPETLDSRELCWDEAGATLRFRHHRLRAPGRDPFQEGLNPDWCQPTPAGNVQLWAAFCDWLISRGQRPVEFGRRISLQDRTPGVNQGLADLIELCLFGSPEERPNTGLELAALLRMVPGVVQRSPGATGAAPPVRTPDPTASEIFKIRQSLGDLRKQGKVEQLPEVAEGRLDAFRERLQAVELPELPGLPGWPRLWENRRPVLLGIGGLLGLLFLFWVFAGQDDISLQRANPAELTHLEVSREDLLRDPYIARLGRITSVSPREFQPVWNLVRTLAIQGRLPARLRNQERLLKMYEAFPKEPDTACGELERFLEELRGLMEAP